MAESSLPRAGVTWLPLALLAATACSESGEPDTAQAERSGAKPDVGVTELESHEVDLVTELPARTEAYRVAAVRPQVSGILEERSFKQGARVKAGEALYRIDAKRYRAAFEGAKADLATAKAALSAARRREKRLASLLGTDAVSRQQYDDAETTLHQRRAEVQAAKAALQAARVDLDYTSVESPIRGRVGPARVTVGALVTANQPQALTQVTRLDPIYVDIQRSVEEVRRLRRALKEKRLEKAEPGKAKVQLVYDGGEVYEHAGRLEVADVTVSKSTGSVTLRAVFPNPDHDLLPGMYVRARLREGVEHAILAPQQGVTRNERGEATALILDGDNEVVKRELEVGRAVGSFWLVKSGLEAGDRLIVSGLQEVRPGAEAKAVAADIPNRPERVAQDRGAAGDPETPDEPDAQTAPAAEGGASG